MNSRDSAAAVKRKSPRLATLANARSLSHRWTTTSLPPPALAPPPSPSSRARRSFTHEARQEAEATLRARARGVVPRITTTAPTPRATTAAAPRTSDGSATCATASTRRTTGPTPRRGSCCRTSARERRRRRRGAAAPVAHLHGGRDGRGQEPDDRVDVGAGLLPAEPDRPPRPRHVQDPLPPSGRATSRPRCPRRARGRARVGLPRRDRAAGGDGRAQARVGRRLAPRRRVVRERAAAAARGASGLPAGDRLRQSGRRRRARACPPPRRDDGARGARGRGA